MIGKGAALDIPYFDRGNSGPTFNSDAGYLSTEHNWKVTVFKGTPIMVAAKNGNDAVVEMLKTFGANSQLKAQAYFLERKITGVTRDHHLTVQPAMVVNGRGAHAGFSPQYEETVRVQSELIRSNHQNYQLNDQLKLVKA